MHCRLFAGLTDIAECSINVNDRVAYSVQFLKSIGMCHTDMAHAKGKVMVLRELSKDCMLASIAWDSPHLPIKVNTKNLAKVGPNRRYANCE